ncbi:MAG: alkaline phosphatase family protein, partial [Burkholderiales bacterium]
MPKPLTDRIEHIVVLMLENRSFDNVFGGLY